MRVVKHARKILDQLQSCIGNYVSCPMSEGINNGVQYRGLGLIPEINKIYIREIERALNRL